MDPNSALPSYRVYRGSLLALLIGSVFAVWLLVRPGGEADPATPPAALAAVLPTQTVPALATQPARTPTPGASPAPTASPAASPAPNATTAPGASATPARTPTPTPTPVATNRTYTVKAGDTLYGIADQYRGTVTLADYFDRLLTLNGLRETSLISAGDVLRIPPP